MVVYKCPRTDCGYKTDELEAAQAIFLQIHAGEQQAAPPAPARAPPPTQAPPPTAQ